MEPTGHSQFGFQGKTRKGMATMREIYQQGTGLFFHCEHEREGEENLTEGAVVAPHGVSPDSRTCVDGMGGKRVQSGANGICARDRHPPGRDVKTLQ